MSDNDKSVGNDDFLASNINSLGSYTMTKKDDSYQLEIPKNIIKKIFDQTDLPDDIEIMVESEEYNGQECIVILSNNIE